jgi:hypothetical protein
MEISNFQFPKVLLPVPIKQEAGWVPELRLGGSLNQSGCCREEKTICHCCDLNSSIIQPTITIPNEVTQLHKKESQW